LLDVTFLSLLVLLSQQFDGKGDCPEKEGVKKRTVERGEEQT
jgi:hypothetical protein